MINRSGRLQVRPKFEMKILSFSLVTVYAKRNPNEAAFCDLTWSLGDRFSYEDIKFVCDSKLGNPYSRKRKGLKLFKDPKTGLFVFNPNPKLQIQKYLFLFLLEEGIIKLCKLFKCSVKIFYHRLWSIVQKILPLKTEQCRISKSMKIGD